MLRAGRRSRFPPPAHQAGIGGEVAGILPGGTEAGAPEFAGVAPERFHALDTGAIHVAVLAGEGLVVRDHILDQVIDFVAEQRQRELVVRPRLVAEPQLLALRLLRIERGIAAEAIEIRRVGSAEGAAGRQRQLQRVTEPQAVFGVPGPVAAEDVVVRVARGEQQPVRAEGRLVLQVVLLRPRVGGEGQPPGIGTRVLVLQQYSRGQRWCSATVMSFCQSRVQRSVRRRSADWFWSIWSRA